MRANIHYLFPEGCHSPEVKIPQIEKKDENIEIPDEARINEQIYEEEAIEEIETSTTFDSTNVEGETVEPIFAIEIEGEETCEDLCCEENRPQIIFSREDPNSCCKSVSKLLIPINLSEFKTNPVPEIEEISKTADPVTMLLKLLRFIEKCRE